MRRAFTIIELLIVISILAILMSIITIHRPRLSDDAAVRLAARELQATMLKARNLAVSTGQAYAVTFNIENAGDGRVMWNRNPEDPTDRPDDAESGHWYAIIGPQRINDKDGMQPPLPHLFHYGSMGSFTAAVRKTQVGDRHFLPDGVRFLALSDYDMGAYINTFWVYRNGLYPQEYPRPWFGVLRPATMHAPSLSAPSGAMVWYPWGGYDMEWEAANPVGTDVGSGAQRGGYPRSGFNRRGDLDFPSPAPVTWADGPIIRGYAMDFNIMFWGDGQAMADKPFYAQNEYGDHDIWESKTNSHQDREYPSGLDFYASGPQADIEVTGGYHITLCRDVDPTDDIYPVPGRYDIFRNETDAIDSITPFIRVYVNRRSGQVELRDANHPLSEIHMNQKNLVLEDVGFTVDKSDRVPVFRSAFRYAGFTLFLNPSLQDADWTEDGWRGWFPAY